MSVINSRSRELSQDQKSDRRFWLFILLFLGTISLLLCVILLLPLTVRSTPWLDVSLHSIMAADYRADLNPLLVNPVGMGVVAEVLQDTTGTPTPGMFETIVVELQTPVSTVTPHPQGGVTNTPGNPSPTEPPVFPTTTNVPQATHTPRPPGVPTPTPTTGPGPTSTPTYKPTPTPPGVPTDTPASPPTHQPPTNTPRPTKTPASPPTRRPPTKTPQPTDTQPLTKTPHPTHTQPPPPTDTPVPPPTRTPPRPPTRTSPPYPPPPYP